MIERRTKQKKQVYDALAELRNHPTAEQVYAHLQESGQSVSRATVYRILDRLADKGEIRRIPVAGEADRFDHTLPVHFHLRCDRCGRMEDYFIEDGDETVRRLAQESGIALSGYELLFRGLCSECREKEKK